MAKFWSLWVFLHSAFFAGCWQVNTESFKSEQVFVTSSLCGKEIDIDPTHGNWRRLLVPEDEACSGAFDCRVTFRMADNISIAADICVDYSRLQVFGSKTTFIVYEKEGKYGLGKFHQRLDDGRYPAIEKYMSELVCINARNALVLKFTSDCDRSLDRSFMSWLYVYLETSATGSIYFVDGTSKHRHKITKVSQSKVTLRSYIWSDTHSDLHKQQSSMRVSMDTNSRKYRLCVRWSPFLPNRDTRRVPSGLTISISKVYINMDLSRPVQTFVHLKEGDNVPVGSECYVMSYIQEMAIAVHRDRGEEVAADQLGDGELLFELVAEARPQELKEEDYVDEEPAIAVETDVDSYTPDDTKDTMVLFMKVLLGGATAVGAICCICAIARKASRGLLESPDGESTNQSCQPGVHGGSSIWTAGETGNTSAAATSPESHPMMPVGTPSAPWEEMEGENTTMTGPALSDAPPSYDAVAMGVERRSPPKYDDLFPASRT